MKYMRTQVQDPEEEAASNVAKSGLYTYCSFYLVITNCHVVNYALTLRLHGIATAGLRKTGPLIPETGNAVLVTYDTARGRQ